MKEQRVAACLIVGDSYNEDEIKILLESLHDKVHGIFVAYNGTDETRKGSLGWQNFSPSIPIYQENFEWEDDFALARNQSFSMVPKDEYDWYLWLDTDDKLVVDDNIQEMFKTLDPYTMGIFVRYDYAIEPLTGIVVVEQWRERFLSTKVPWKWEFAIHEVCKGTVGTVQFAKREHCHIEHLRTNGDDRGARIRNRRIISRCVGLYPDEPRYIFYLASETLAEASTTEFGPERDMQIEAALIAFDKYKRIAGSVDDDFYIAQNRIAELLFMRGSFIDSLDAHLECIAIYPEWPDAYVGAAKCCMELSNWSRMKSFAEMASKCPKPMTAAGIESMNSSFYPVFLRGIAEFELGEYEQSMKDFKQAKKFWNPPDGQIDKKIKEIKKLIKRNAENSTDERKILRGTKPEKSIAFFTSPLPFTWHPKVESGAGAELCVTKIAQRFAGDGWRVAVFGTPGEHRGVYEGIEWWNSDEYNPLEPFTVFVSSRSPAPFEGEINSLLKILWMHDVNSGPSLNIVKDKIDRIAGLTNWHVKHLMNLYNLSGSKMGVIPNGIELDRFPVDRSNDPDGAPKFIWSSSADRGLDTLLGLWPVIKERYPESELKIFYGWEIINSVIENNKKLGVTGSWMENLRDSILGQIEWLGGEQAGIYNNGRVDQQTLAKEMYSSNYWPYTTAFMETFCITAIECFAAGVIPITSDLAALGDILKPLPTLISGWPLNKDYQVRWLKKLDNIVNNEDQRLEIRGKGRDIAEKFTWDESYKKWINLLKTSGISL